WVGWPRGWSCFPCFFRCAPGAGRGADRGSIRLIPRARRRTVPGACETGEQRREAAMNVAAILARKGSEVITAAADAALMDAAKILDERRIGAVIILGPDRKPVGVLSERDITAAVARDGAA